MGGGIIRISRAGLSAVQISQYQIRLALIESDLDPLHLRMIFVVRPDRVTKHRPAVEAVDDPKSVYGGVGPPESGIDRRDRLCPRHVVYVDFKKSLHGLCPLSRVLSSRCHVPGPFPVRQGPFEAKLLCVIDAGFRMR